MNHAQEKLMSVIEDEGSAQVLANIWQMVEGAPLQAAKVIRALEQSSSAVSKIALEIPEAWKKLDEQVLESDVRRQQFIEDLRKFRSETLSEVSALVTTFSELKTALAGIDEDKLLNKANRIIETANSLQRLKRDGTLDLLTKLLK